MQFFLVQEYFLSNYDSYITLNSFYHMQKTYFASMLNLIAYNSGLFADNRLSNLNFSYYPDYVQYSNTINTNLLIRLNENIETLCSKYLNYFCFSFMSSTHDIYDKSPLAYGNNAYYLSDSNSNKTANFSIYDL